MSRHEYDHTYIKTLREPETVALVEKEATAKYIGDEGTIGRRETSTSDVNLHDGEQS